MRKLKNISWLLFSFMFILSSCATAQMGYGTKSKKAIKLYEEGRQIPNTRLNPKTKQPDFEGGIEVLKKALQKDENFLEAHQMIGEFYRITNKPKDAVYHFKRSLEINPAANLNGQLFLDIGDLQIKNGEFEDAIRYFDLIIERRNQRVPERVVTMAMHLREIADFNITARKNPLKIEPINVGKGVNTKYPEYFPTITVDGKTLLFTREIPFNPKAERGQEDFFVSELGKDNVWGPAYPMPGNINTMLNEGAPTISADGRTLIFVACADMTGFDYGPNREGMGSCDLFITEKIGDKWTDPVNLPGKVNTQNWESQPSLAADGKTLYFVRRVGGRGEQRTDIFVSEKQTDGTWGIAKPLPSNINTPGKETSVLIHPDGQTLYFASDTHPGLGGYDLFMTRKDPLGNWSDPINLGYPINTESNENSLLVGPDGKIAFFASDRPGGEGQLDIYTFELPESLRPVKTTYFEGKVYDITDNRPLKGRFELVDIATGEVVIQSTADRVTGEFMLALPTQKEYALNVTYPGYTFFSKNFNMTEQEDAIHMDVPMVPILAEYAMTLENVFFDLNKSTLRKESYVELNKLRDFLSVNSGIKIEIGGHTDSRGDSKLNKKLSEDRAKSVYDYLISQGIEATRLSYKGYGAEKPKRTDAEIAQLAANQAEKAHQENRRTEYRIVK